MLLNWPVGKKRNGVTVSVKKALRYRHYSQQWPPLVVFAMLALSCRNLPPFTILQYPLPLLTRGIVR